MIRTIPLTKGLHATVSDHDYKMVAAYKWHADVGRHTTYAKSSQVIPARLHNFIMNPPIGLEVHHKDRNGLNCQRENLMIVNRSGNLRFLAKRLNKGKKESKYKGVYFDKWGNRFSARITVNYKRKFLGRFATEEEAALAYNEAARQLFGEGNFEPNIITPNLEGSEQSCLGMASGQTS